MAFFLLLETLAQGFHQLFKAAQSLDLGLFLVAQMFFGHLGQPVLGQINRIKHLIKTDFLKALEGGGEGLIEFVQIALVLHHRYAGKVVKGFDVIGRQPGFHAFEKGQKLAQRDRDTMFAQAFIKGQEHQIRPPCDE